MDTDNGLLSAFVYFAPCKTNREEREERED